MSITTLTGAQISIGRVPVVLTMLGAEPAVQQ
jgi:hypothetical protein